MNDGLPLAMTLTVGLVLLCVGVHYEALRTATVLCARLPIGRFRVVLVILVAILAHAVEALFFAVGIAYLESAGVGRVVGAETFADRASFSFTTYTPLGFGALVPTGRLRILSSLEAVTGLVLIAWTASFTYYEMQRYWRE